MNHKQKIYQAIERTGNGIIPFDVFEGWMWPEIARKSMQKVGAADFDEFLTKIHASCRWITTPYKGPVLQPGAFDRIASPHTRYSLNASIWGLKPGLKEHGHGSKGHPLALCETIRGVTAHPWPHPDWFDYESIKEARNKYPENFLIFGGFSPIFYLIADLCGMEKALIDLMLNPSVIRAIIEKIEEFYSKYFTRVAKAGQGILDGIAFGDDFASQSSTLLSPEQWRTYFKPVWRRLFAIAKKHNLKVFFHSCGAVSEVIPDLIDIGLDVLYPIQPLSDRMDIENLTKEFGSDLSFYGGFDVQNILPFGTPSDIEKEVTRILSIVRRGYIMSTSHVIMEDVPVENVLALYGALYRNSMLRE